MKWALRPGVSKKVTIFGCVYSKSHMICVHVLIDFARNLEIKECYKFYFKNAYSFAIRSNFVVGLEDQTELLIVVILMPSHYAQIFVIQEIVKISLFFVLVDIEHFVRY